MSTHLENDLENVKLKMFEMADMAIDAIRMSVESLKKSDVATAEQVIQNDTYLDKMEIMIDDACIKLLVTRQPAAGDLRLVLAVLKINTDLERIGDLATNIAKETIRCDGRTPLKPLVDIPRMGGICIEMLKDALQAISTRDVARAQRVIETDTEIDYLNMQIYRELFLYMAENPHTITQAMGLIMVSKALERIGDHATNIAERAIYYIQGEDVRHQL